MSESIPYFNDALEAIPDEGYDLWPSDPFGSPVVQFVMQHLPASRVEAATLPEILQSLREAVALEVRWRDDAATKGREYRHNPIVEIDPREGLVVWALRNLIAHGQAVFIHDRVPAHLINHERRGQWVELFCHPEQEGDIRRSWQLPPRTSISAKRPRATLALSDTRAAVWAMTDGHCWYCGIRTNPFDDFCIDHVRPVALGGSDDLDNLVPACTRCNRDKGKLTVEAFRAMRAQWVGVKPDGYSFYFERMGYRP